jgi:hypothetical protein
VGEEVIVPFDAPRPTIALATQVRSTLLCSSLNALRARKLYDAYLAALPRDLHDTMLTLIPGLWVGVDLAVAHYTACDALTLTVHEIEGIGAAVAEKIHHSFIGVIVKISREAGATPWTVFGHVKKLRDLTWRGSDIAVTKLGPKEARFEWAGIPCARSLYYKRSFAGFLRANAELVSRKAYAVPLDKYCTDRALGYRLSWV